MNVNTVRMDERERGGQGTAPRTEIPVSDAVRAELAHLRERVMRLEDEKRELEAFTGLAAHELLEPLVMADAYAQMAAERLSGDEHADTLCDLEALTRTLARTRVLVETLLQETAAPGRLLEKRPVNLRGVAEEALVLLAPEITARGVRVHVGELPTVRGDEALLSGLVRNLFVNALKYGPRTGGEVVVTARRDEGQWRISISSDGPTISASDRQRIFQPFRRGFGERRARGSGLGLSICQRIVERHGGRIDVAPGRDVGNIFFFTIPD